MWSNCTVNAVNTFMNTAFGQPDFCDMDMLPAEPPRNDGSAVTLPWWHAAVLAAASAIVLAL